MQRDLENQQSINLAILQFTNFYFSRSRMTKRDCIISFRILGYKYKLIPYRNFKTGKGLLLYIIIYM
jgi:hypothetical protein